MPKKVIPQISYFNRLLQPYSNSCRKDYTDSSNEITKTFESDRKLKALEK